MANIPNKVTTTTGNLFGWDVCAGAGNITTPVSLDTVQGKMISVSLVVDDLEILNPDQIKETVALMLVRKMIDGKNIEFTKDNNMPTGQTLIRARVFVTTDEKVRVIRKTMGG